MKRIETAVKIIRDHSHLFMCPLCDAAMHVNDRKSLVCSNQHCFDLAKSGYINLISGSVRPTKYDKKMFQSRQAICESGFFDQMIECVLQTVRDDIRNKNAKQYNILDAGCGEGSHLADLVKGLSLTTPCEVMGVGLDISKEGCLLASRKYPGLIWCVADLARSPFMKRQFDVIVNILSPSNYMQFSRMLRDDGILIKIVPGSDYLKELRQAFYGQTARQTYSNEDVIRHFDLHFSTVVTRQIQYRKDLDQNSLQHLICMTPLSWGTAEENLQNALQSGMSSVTVDLNVLAGKKKPTDNPGVYSC